MIKVLERRYASQKEVLYNMASGLYNAGFAIGQVIGPIAGTMLTGYIGFSNSYLILAAVFLLYILPLTYAFFFHKEAWRGEKRVDGGD